MKFIITEEEKKQIRFLYEQKKTDVLVTKANPFKNTSIKIKNWSDNLNDGELYFKWYQTTRSYFMMKINDLLKGKTFRDKEVVYKIDGVKNLDLNEDLERINAFGPIKWVTFETSPHSYSGVEFNPNANKSTYSKNIYNYLVKNLPKITELDDTFFEIWKVSNDTDFKP